MEVYRWSSGAYLECQDMWRLSGIERDVYLYSTPKQYIADYKLNASLEKEKYKDGIFGLEVTVEGHSAISGATSIAYTLKDADGKAVLQGAIRIKSRGLSNFITFDEKNIPDVKAWSAQHAEHAVIALKHYIINYRFQLFHFLTATQNKCFYYSYYYNIVFSIRIVI